MGTKLESRTAMSRTPRLRSILLTGMLLAACGALLGACDGEDPAADETQVQRGIAAIAGIPQDGFTLGRQDAPWTLSVVSSATSYELDQFITLLPAVTDQFVRPGRLNLQLRTPTSGRYQGDGDDSRIAAGALLAAGLQGHFWDALVRFVPTHRGQVTVNQLRALLERAGVRDVALAMRQRTSPRVHRALDVADAAGQTTNERRGVAYVLAPAGGPAVEITNDATKGNLAVEIERLMALPPAQQRAP